jgi:hypothetical protein
VKTRGGLVNFISRNITYLTDELHHLPMASVNLGSPGGLESGNQEKKRGEINARISFFFIRIASKGNIH